jgi:hypothetical protein
MLYSKIKLTTASILALTFAGAGFWQARCWADGNGNDSGAKVSKTISEESFHVKLKEVCHDDSTLVIQIDVETPARSTVVVSKDRGAHGGIRISSSAGDSDRPDGRSHLQLVILADRVKLKVGSTTAVKFVLGYKIGSISGSTGETVSIPTDGKQLADFLSVPIKSGVYQYGQPTKLVIFNGVTYNLVVNKST